MAVHVSTTRRQSRMHPVPVADAADPLPAATLPGWDSFPPDSRSRVIQLVVQTARRQLQGPTIDPARTGRR
ncbi:MAG: hypothetical protein HYX51_11410 [Chloroflexi bacterium]|nr:hypothetical protein [Chloroflexota bacterium]